MTFKRLVQLAAAGILLGITSHGLAQSTAMESRQGFRHAGPGAVNPSTSTFLVGVTRDNGASYVNTASVSDNVEIRGEIRPESGNVNQVADIFVVDRLVNDQGGHISFSMRTAAGVWEPWNGTVALLQPFREDVSLTSGFQLTMFNGTLGTAGNHRLFLGYMAPDGVLRYHPTGVPVTITEAQTQTPLVQATVLFETKVSPNIVSTICVACHMSGGAAGNVHTFIGGSSSAALTADFNTLRGLAARGTAFIMNYIGSPSTLHGGGQLLQPGSTDYNDMQQLLNLMQQL